MGKSKSNRGFLFNVNESIKKSLSFFQCNVSFKWNSDALNYRIVIFDRFARNSLKTYLEIFNAKPHFAGNEAV